MDLVARQLSVCNNRYSAFPVQCIELILGILSNDCLLVCTFEQGDEERRRCKYAKISVFTRCSPLLYLSYLNIG